MKIVRPEEIDSVSFEKLKEGDVFILKNNYYIKTNKICNENGNDRNAVNLETGEIVLVYLSTIVRMVNCELVIK